jgi:hypothetical protein
MIPIMRRRGVISTTILLLAATLLQLPCATIGWWLFYNNAPEARFLGFNAYARLPDPLHRNATMIRDRLFLASARPKDQKQTHGPITVESLDPTTEKGLKADRLKMMSQDIAPFLGWTLHVVGDANHMWVIGQLRQSHPGVFESDIFEIIGNDFVARPALPNSSQRPMLFPKQLAHGDWYEFSSTLAFVLDGKLSSVFLNPAGLRELHQLIDGKWVSQGEIELFSKTGFGDGPVVPPPHRIRTGMSTSRLVEILPIGDMPHLFWRMPGILLYRRGTEFLSADRRMDASKTTETDESEILSALEPMNVLRNATNWQLVMDDLANGSPWLSEVNRALSQSTSQKKGFLLRGRCAWIKIIGSSLHARNCRSRRS